MSHGRPWTTMEQRANAHGHGSCTDGGALYCLIGGRHRAGLNDGLYYPLRVSRRMDTWQIVYLSYKEQYQFIKGTFMSHECTRDQYPFNGQMRTGTGPALVNINKPNACNYLQYYLSKRYVNFVTLLLVTSKKLVCRQTAKVPIDIRPPHIARVKVATLCTIGLQPTHSLT